MKTFGKRTIGFISILLGAILLFPGQAPAGPKGRLVNALSSDISTLDPHNHNIRINYIVGWHLYDNLVQRNQTTMKIEPLLAESWKIIDDLTWELKLRKGVKFDNGEPFNAECVKFSIDRGQDPKCPQRPSVSWIKEVQVVDDHTVRLVTHKPFPVALQRLGNYQMLPVKWVKEKGIDHLATHANGTGPYRLKEWKRGVHIILEAKEDYFMGAPAIKTISPFLTPTFP